MKGVGVLNKFRAGYCWHLDVDIYRYFLDSFAFCGLRVSQLFMAILSELVFCASVGNGSSGIPTRCLVANYV